MQNIENYGKLRISNYGNKFSFVLMQENQKVYFIFYSFIFEYRVLFKENLNHQ